MAGTASNQTARTEGQMHSGSVSKRSAARVANIHFKKRDLLKVQRRDCRLLAFAPRPPLRCRRDVDLAVRKPARGRGSWSTDESCARRQTLEAPAASVLRWRARHFLGGSLAAAAHCEEGALALRPQSQDHHRACSTKDRHESPGLRTRRRTSSNANFRCAPLYCSRPRVL